MEVQRSESGGPAKKITDAKRGEPREPKGLEPKALDPSRALGRLRDAKTRLERCRFWWQRKQAVGMIESLIVRPDASDLLGENLNVAIRTLLRTCDDEDERVAERAKNALHSLQFQRVKRAPESPMKAAVDDPGKPGKVEE